MTHGPHDFLPLEPLAPSPLALRELVGLPPSHWLSQSPWGASPTHLGVQDPGLGVTGTERDWGWPGRPRGVIHVQGPGRTQRVARALISRTAPVYKKHPLDVCLFVCFPVKERIGKKTWDRGSPNWKMEGAALMVSRSLSSLTARILESRGVVPLGLRRAGFGERPQGGGLHGGGL